MEVHSLRVWGPGHATAQRAEAHHGLGAAKKIDNAKLALF